LEYAAHEARMSVPNEDGVTLRSMQEERARRGLPGAQEALDGPLFPTDLEYLYGYASELVGRSGHGMSGLAPVSNREIEAFERLHGITLEPFEVEAIYRLDGVMRNPPKEEEVKQESPKPVPVAAWPERKKNG
jgi:hypothetical protein